MCIKLNRQQNLNGFRGLNLNQIGLHFTNLTDIQLSKLFHFRVEANVFLKKKRFEAKVFFKRKKL